MDIKAVWVFILTMICSYCFGGLIGLGIGCLILIFILLVALVGDKHG